MPNPVRLFSPVFDLGKFRVRSDFFRPIDLTDTSVFKDIRFLPAVPPFSGPSGRLTSPLFAPAPIGRGIGEGLLAMGKKGRRSEAKKEKKAVVLGEESVVVNGTEISYLNYYINTKKAIRGNSTPENRRRAELMDILERRGDYQSALKMALLEKAGDQKWWRDISGIARTAEPDIGVLIGIIDSHFTRAFPDASELPTADGLWTELNRSWMCYKEGGVSAEEMSYTLTVYSNLEAARPVFDGDDIRIGALTITRAELLEMSKRKLRSDIDDFLDGGRKDALDLYNKTIDAGKRRIHAKLEGAYSIGAMEEAIRHMVFYRALNFLESGEVPQAVKEEAAALFLIGGDENYQGNVLLFTVYVEARQTSPKYFAITCRMDLDISPSFVTSVHKRFLKVFGIAEAEPPLEADIRPVSLNEETNTLPAPSSDMSPGRSLAIFEHRNFFVRFMLNALRSQLTLLKAVDAGTHDKVKFMIRFLENSKYSTAAKAILIDMIRQLSLAHQHVAYDACAIVIGFASDPTELDKLLHELYFRAHNRAQAVLAAVQAAPAAKGVQAFLSERRFSADRAAGWDRFLAEAYRHGIGEPVVIERLSEAVGAIAGDESVVERWLGVLNWAGLEPYLSGPLGEEEADAMASALQDAAYPPKGGWIDSRPDETLGLPGVSEPAQRRFAAAGGFLSRSGLDGLKATVRAAEDDTNFTFDVYTSRFRDRPIAMGHPDLKMWLELWPQETPDRAAVDTVLYKLSGWMHGEADGVDPMGVRTLVRRGIGDSLSLRSLFILAHMNLPAGSARAVIAKTQLVLERGAVRGDIMGLVMKASVRMDGISMSASRAELSSVVEMLSSGQAVRLIPTDKALNDPTPDMAAVDAGGVETLVEVKTVHRRPGDIEYLDPLGRKIQEAGRQLESYAENAATRRVVHIYVLSSGEDGISDAAVRWARDSARSVAGRIDEISLIPVNIFNDSWREGETIALRP